MMEVIDVVMKLIGEIEPIGETHVDTYRLENLKNLTALVDGLLEEIHGVSKSKDCAEYSKQLMGNHAYRFLRYVRDGSI